MIKVERVYNSASSDGFRILVDRLWPRGLKKRDIKVDLWLKDIGPSNDLRKWFNHDPAKWNEFKHRFSLELDMKRELVSKIAQQAREGDVVLLFGAKDLEHNNAVALKEYLEK
jgi:uncharacterized protein YeaO (DUF488 family)